MKPLLRVIKKPVFQRFIGVGTISTAIDFSILFLLQHFGLHIIAANILSTTVAFCFSFYANKRFTFKTSGNVRRELLLYVIVTLTGIWILQNIIISVLHPQLTKLFDDELSLLLSKLTATGVSMVWNYLLYKNVVFKDAPTTEGEIK